MRYLILIYAANAAFISASGIPAHAFSSPYMRYNLELGAAKVSLGGASLQLVATATTVRVANGKTVTTDGPFAETKEQLGGYYTSRGQQ